MFRLLVAGVLIPIAGKACQQRFYESLKINALAFRKTGVYDSRMHPHKQIIEAIGPKVVQDAYSLSRQRLHAWKKRGIPHSHRVAVAKLAAMNGVTLPGDFFAGMAA